MSILATVFQRFMFDNTQSGIGFIGLVSFHGYKIIKKRYTDDKLCHVRNDIHTLQP